MVDADIGRVSRLSAEAGRPACGASGAADEKPGFPEKTWFRRASVVFLGTGGAFSAGRRSTPALLIEASGFRMLAEAGPVIMQQLARVNLQATDIERLFVTHGHGDHTLGFPILALNRAGAATPLHVYGGPNTLDALQTLGTLAFSGLREHLRNIHWHEVSETAPDETELAPGVTLRTVMVPYPPGVPTLAARWDFADGPSLTYVTDTFPNAAAEGLARDSDLLIHEASYSAALQPNADPATHFHSTAQQAGEVARRARCRRLALMHLGPEIGEQPEVLAEEARAGTDLEVIVPEDGERIHITEEISK
jgi:ribonuclease Z